MKVVILYIVIHVIRNLYVHVYSKLNVTPPNLPAWVKSEKNCLQRATKEHKVRPHAKHLIHYRMLLHGSETTES